MPFTNYPQGFAAGLSVRGMPLTQMQPGQVFFVGNSTVLNPNQRAGSDGRQQQQLRQIIRGNTAVDISLRKTDVATAEDVVTYPPIGEGQSRVRPGLRTGELQQPPIRTAKRHFSAAQLPQQTEHPARGRWFCAHRRTLYQCIDHLVVSSAGAGGFEKNGTRFSHSRSA